MSSWGQIAALARGGPLLGCLLGNQTRDFVEDFFIGISRSSELGSATNEKTQAVGPGFGFLVAGTLRISNLLPDYYRIIFTHEFLFEELIKTSIE